MLGKIIELGLLLLYSEHYLISLVIAYAILLFINLFLWHASKTGYYSFNRKVLFGGFLIINVIFFIALLFFLRYSYLTYYMLILTLSFLSAFLLISFRIMRKSRLKLKLWKMLPIILLSIIFILTRVYALPLLYPYGWIDETLPPLLAKDFPDLDRVSLKNPEPVSRASIAALYIPYFAVFSSAMTFIPMSIFISYLCFLLFLLLVWKIFHDWTVVYVSAILIIFNPYMILHSRSIYPSYAPYLFSIIMAYSAYSYLEKKDKDYLHLFILSIGLLGLMKPEHIILGIPFLILFYSRFGKKMILPTIALVILILLALPRYVLVLMTRMNYIISDNQGFKGPLIQLNILGLSPIYLLLLILGLYFAYPMIKREMTLVWSSSLIMVFYVLTRIFGDNIVTIDKVLFPVSVAFIFIAYAIRRISVKMPYALFFVVVIASLVNVPVILAFNEDYHYGKLEFEYKSAKDVISTVPKGYELITAQEYKYWMSDNNIDYISSVKPIGKRAYFVENSVCDPSVNDSQSVKYRSSCILFMSNHNLTLIRVIKSSDYNLRNKEYYGEIRIYEIDQGK